MCVALRERHRSYERVRAEFDRFHTETADDLLQPGTSQHEESAALAAQLAQRFEELAATAPDTAEGALLLQYAVLAHIGDTIRDEDDAAYEAMKRIAEFLERMSVCEKKSD